MRTARFSNFFVISVTCLILTTAVLTGCKGFFVDPILQSITVTPSNSSLVVGATQQMSAVGTFNDGSTSVVTSKSTWSTSNAAIATVTSGGLVTAVNAGTTPPTSVTITATDGAISSSTTISVTNSALQSISITSVPSPASISKQSGSTVQMTAMGHFADGSITDITSSVTWISSDTNVVTVSSAGVVTATTTSTVSQTANITASSGTITSNAIVVTINL